MSQFDKNFAFKKYVLYHCLMSDFKKSHMTVDGNTVHLSMPFAKVNKSERLVSGFATLDNIDSQGDIVLAEASAKAFARARGNIREMHQPIAVGKMVDFREEEFFHDKKFYRGIFVTAHVSEGAEDTWKKVLDGTLTGFSIGGEINEATHEFVKEANGGKGAKVRFIKDYDLVELSLVDNPANQLANVLSIQKSNTGEIVVKAGEVVDTVVENVFICKTPDCDGFTILKATDSETCPNCGEQMENAGWFESNGQDKTEKVASVIAKFWNPKGDAAPISDEGGVEMAKSTDGTVPEAKETNVPNPSEEFPDGEKVEDEAPATEEVDEAADSTPEGEAVEEPAEVEEVQDDQTEISKKIDELHNAVQKSLESSKEETLEKVSELEQIINSTREDFMAKASELESKIDGYGDKIEAQKARLSELERSLNKFNSSSAIKKSADVETSSETNVQKDSFWGNAFSG